MESHSLVFTGIHRDGAHRDWFDDEHRRRVAVTASFVCLHFWAGIHGISR
ncbi:hypothetical protein HMPREF1861_00942 [Corynebacterium kroppenstedtii]|nr:hypothetical protein HMPREF1861_00942 [Corynebacterium kroppenstedtii]